MAGWRRFGGGSWRAVVQVIVVTTVLAIALPAAAVAQPAVRHPHAAHVAKASQRFGIPEHWIIAVMRAESAGDPRAVSAAGAMGLMQVMPDTWAELRARHQFGDDPFDTRDNIMAGTAYLREMWDRYGNVSSMLAAYNAGPGRNDEYLTTGRPLPAETRAYVAALAPVLRGEPLPEGAASPRPVTADWREAPLFVAPFGSTSDARSAPAGAAIGGYTTTLAPRDEATGAAPVNAIFEALSGQGDRP